MSGLHPPEGVRHVPLLHRNTVAANLCMRVHESKKGAEMVDRKKVELEAGLLDLLGQPTRLTLLYMLRDGEKCVCELHPKMAEDQSVISRHLIKLRDAGLIEARKAGVSVFYTIREPRVFDLLDQVDAILRTALEAKAREAMQAL